MDSPCPARLGPIARGRNLGTTHGVAVASDDSVFILHTGATEGDPCIRRFAPNGALIASWGAQFFGGGHGLECVMLQGEERLLITDQKRGLFCCDLDGEVLWKLKKPQFYKKRPHLNWAPSNVAIDAEGHIHLSDGYGSYFITVLSAAGEELHAYGGPGFDDKNILAPHGLGLVDGEIVICENNQEALAHFTAEGTWIKRHTADDLRAPRHIIPWRDGYFIPDLAGWLGLVALRRQ